MEGRQKKNICECHSYKEINLIIKPIYALLWNLCVWVGVCEQIIFTLSKCYKILTANESEEKKKRGRVVTF